MKAMPPFLSPQELQRLDAHWRAANYLSVGQIYLYANPLLTEPLRIEHIKPRLLGHWGTTPGLNFVYTHANPDSLWRFRSPEGDIAVPVRGNLRLNDDEVIWQAVLGGAGISILPTFTVGKDLQSGSLQAVLTEYVPREANLYALYLPNRHLTAKVRVFIDFLLARFEPPPYWDRGWSVPNVSVRQRARVPRR